MHRIVFCIVFITKHHFFTTFGLTEITKEAGSEPLLAISFRSDSLYIALMMMIMVGFLFSVRFMYPPIGLERFSSNYKSLSPIPPPLGNKRQAARKIDVGTFCLTLLLYVNQFSHKLISSTVAYIMRRTCVPAVMSRGMGFLCFLLML